MQVRGQTHTHTHEWTETRRSNPPQSRYIYIAYVCCLLWSRPLASSLVAMVVRSPSTTGCRSSSRSRCLLLSSRSRKKKKHRRGGRTEEDGGGGGDGGGGFRRGKKQGKRSQKLKILPLAAESHWSQVVTLLMVLVVMVMVLLVVGWTQTWGKPRFSHLD